MKHIYKNETLDNGLRVVFYKMPQRQSVALGIWIKVGSRFEKEENCGSAHFLEHLLFKGSKKYSCRRIKESIEGIGGTLNGFTSEEYSCYLTKLPYRYLELGLDILSDMVLNPLLPASEIEREKNVVLEEIKMYKDSPQSYVHQLLDSLLWSGHPLGMSILGTDESIKRINRRSLLLFKERYYTPVDMVIAACGNLDYQRFLKKIKKLFKIRSSQKKNHFISAPTTRKRPQIKIFAKETEQTHLALGFEGLRRSHPARFALSLLHVILGGNMSSRLFHEVREKKGLAYEIGTQVKYLSDTGSFIVNAGIDNQNVGSCLELILEQLARLKKSLVSAYELKHAKEFFLGQLSLSLEDTLEHMFWIAEGTISLDKTYTLDFVINKVNKIKREDLCILARDIFRNENRHLALIGPLKDRQEKLYESLCK